MDNYSVLMSVYKKDKPEHLRQCIDSMMDQTIPFEQFVIVKDGPLGEELDAVINEYLLHDGERFTVVSLKDNIGLGKALDEGIRHCRNELLARMDADDISKLDRCEKLLKLFESNSELALAGTNIDEFYENPTHVVSSRVVPSEYEDIKRFIKRRSPFNHPTVMFKKSEVLRCGGYGKMRRKQDYDLFSRMINMGCYAVNIDESLLLFRSDEGNYKRRKSWEYCKSYIEVQKENYNRGYCSLIDLSIVVVGQLFMYVAPMKVMKLVSDKFLRKQYK